MKPSLVLLVSALCLGTSCLGLSSTPVLAQDMTQPHGVKTGEALPPLSAAPVLVTPDGEILRLTPDKLQVVHLTKDAVSVLVGSPSHMNVFLETPRTAILVPRQPGATHFEILDGSGNTILSRQVVIASPKENYIRVRRACVNGAEGCAEYSVYYCPDMCHEVRVERSSDNATPPEAPQATASASPGAGSTEPPPPPAEQGIAVPPVPVEEIDPAEADVDGGTTGGSTGGTTP